MRNSPILVAIANIIVFGLGYIILGERKVFGWMLLISEILLLIAVVILEPQSPLFVTVTPTARLIEGIALYALMPLAFGYDAYDLARKKASQATIAHETETA